MALAILPPASGSVARSGCSVASGFTNKIDIGNSNPGEVEPPYRGQSKVAIYAKNVECNIKNIEQ